MLLNGIIYPREPGEADAHVQRPRLVLRVAVPQRRVLHWKVSGGVQVGFEYREARNFELKQINNSNEC